MTERRIDKPEIRALTQLGEEFAAAAARVEAVERAPRRGRGLVVAGRRRIAIAAAVACVVGLLVYALAIDIEGTPSPQTALADVAAVARLQPMPADSQYTYTRALEVNRQLPIKPLGSGHEDDPPGPPLLVTSDRRAWVSIERRGLVVDREISVEPADPDETVDPRRREQALQSATRFSYPRLGRYEFGDERFTREEILRLPTEPRWIVERLRGGLAGVTQPEREMELWETIAETLTRVSAPLPPELRAGLIDSLALVPGVRVRDDAVRVRGRSGREFSMEAAGVKQRIVFDVKTAEVLLTETSVATRRGARDFDQPIGSLIDRYELIESAIVDELPDDPERFSAR